MRRRTIPRLVMSAVSAVAIGVALSFVIEPVAAGVSGWVAFAFSFTLFTWTGLRRLSPKELRDHVSAEEPGRRGAHLVLVACSLASLAGVGVLLMAGADNGGAIPFEAILGVLAVAASWTLVHLLYTVRYAHAYHCAGGDRPAVDFGEVGEPDFRDFAYLAYTIGMTYQVSDTALQDRGLRRIALRHALLSYALGAVVVASTINLVAQLASTMLGGGGGH